MALKGDRKRSHWKGPSETFQTNYHLTPCHLRFFTCVLAPPGVGDCYPFF